MRTTIDLPDELFRRLKTRAVEERLSFKSLMEKASYAYLRQPLRRIEARDVVLPVVGDGSGSVLVNPATWWDDINERS